MALDLNTWRTVIKQAVDGIADEALQRRAWFGIGPEVSSPDEVFCQFFDDAATESFLNRNDTGLNDLQIESGRYLVKLMQEFLNQAPKHIRPSDIIDDPRWKKIRKAAARFSNLLSM